MHRTPGQRNGQPVIRLAVLFYGACVLIAFGWGALAGRPRLVYDPAAVGWPSAAAGVGLGLICGLVTVALSRVALRCAPWARDLFHWFAEVLGPLPRWQVLALAALSSVGEELLFRGAMQPSLGLWPTAAIFALLHFPPRVRLWPWTLMAGALGVVFGFLTRWSANLAGAVVAHFVINALNLGEVARSARGRAAGTGLGRDRTRPSEAEKLPPADPPPSMSDHEQASREATAPGDRRSGDLARPDRGEDR